MRCAECFKQLGLKKGDVIVLMASNHIDLCIPMYAALYLGVMIAALDAGSSVGKSRALMVKLEEPRHPTHGHQWILYLKIIIYVRAALKR